MYLNEGRRTVELFMYIFWHKTMEFKIRNVKWDIEPVPGSCFAQKIFQEKNTYSP